MAYLSIAWDIISLSLIPLILSPLYFWYTTNNIYHLIGFAGIMLTSVSVEALKRFVFSSQHRPQRAKGCDLFCLHETDEGRPGMPSGHAATVAFYGTFYSITNPIYIIYVILMATARYMKNCHSIPQIVAGLLFGAAFGLLFK
jgi:membrane-associated phospholipid phosphatase